jgi:lipopolysaccharide export system protein LptC
VLRTLFYQTIQVLLRFLPLVLMAIVAGITFWMVQVNSPIVKSEAEMVKRHVPSYYMDKLAATELDERGQTKYRFNASRMVQYEDDQTYEVTHPAVRAYEPGRPQVTAMSDVGTMNAEGTIIDMRNNARVLRDQGTDVKRDPVMSARSERFEILLNEDIVQTDQAVELRHGQSIMYANGLIFNNITREVQLQGNVRGTIVSKP